MTTMTWELDGVMVGVLALIGVYHLLPIKTATRNKMTLWTVLLFYVYLTVLILVLAGIVVWEGIYATS